MTKITTPIDSASMVREANSSSQNSLKNQKITTPGEVDKAASGFEALLLHNMLQEMWKTTGSGEGLLGENSNESQIFRDMFNQALADEISEGDGIGVKQFLKNELTKTI
jgi:Rod binding domain-containing protein